MIARLLAFSVVVAPAAASAQEPDDCDADLFRGPRFVTPADGAGGVPLNSPVKVEFSERFFSETGADPATSLVLMDAAGDAVPGTYQLTADSVLFFVPDATLERSSMYSGSAIGIDGDLDFEFRTGTTLDQEPPELGLDPPRLSSQAVDPSCEAPEGGYRIDVSFPPAQDDGPIGSLEYLVFLNRGEDVEAPELRGRLRGFETDLVTIPFVLAPDEAVAPICVQVQVVDGLGRIDDDGTPACIDPVQGNFFEPLCSAVPGRPAAAGGAATPLLLALLALLFRRRRCARSSSSSSPG